VGGRRCRWRSTFASRDHEPRPSGHGLPWRGAVVPTNRLLTRPAVREPFNGQESRSVAIVGPGWVAGAYGGVPQGMTCVTHGRVQFGRGPGFHRGELARMRRARPDRRCPADKSLDVGRLHVSPPARPAGHRRGQGRQASHRGKAAVPDAGGPVLRAAASQAGVVDQRIRASLEPG
jgi:hypothetical protein